MNNPETALLLNARTVGEGPDLVILHGLFGSADNWFSMARKLAGQTRTHLLDLRNHGDSPHQPTMRYAAMAADVINSCQRMGLKKIYLLGHSMGGKVAMEIVQQQPQLLERLVIVDIAPRRYPPNHEQVISALLQLQKRLQQDPTTNRQRADKLLAEKLPDPALRAFLLKSLQRRSDGSWQLQFNLNAIVQSYPDIAAEINFRQAFTGPVLFIKGAMSDYLVDSDHKRITQMFPKVRLKVIDGAGHWPHAEKANVVHGILSRFFNQ